MDSPSHSPAAVEEHQNATNDDIHKTLLDISSNMASLKSFFQTLTEGSSLGRRPSSPTGTVPTLSTGQNQLEDLSTDGLPTGHRNPTGNIQPTGSRTSLMKRKSDTASASVAPKTARPAVPDNSDAISIYASDEEADLSQGEQPDPDPFLLNLSQDLENSDKTSATVHPQLATFFM